MNINDLMAEFVIPGVSAEELKEAEVDEYRVLYSKDGKKLLSCGDKKLLNYRVKEGTEMIWEAAFEDAQLISIELPDSLIAIGPCAFHNCMSLTSVIIPDNVVTIFDSAFSKCSSLETVTLGKSTAFLDGSTFLGCDSLTDIFVPEENERYCSLGGILYTKDMRELAYCPQLKPFDGVVFPESVTKIGDYAFSHFPALTVLSVPGSIAVIGEHAFSSCESLVSVTIASGVKEIGRAAFFECNALTSLAIDEGVSLIGEYAFSGCPLTSVEIPRGVKKIETGVFYKCESLKSATIPAGVSYIGEAAFGSCPNLERIISLNPLPPIVEFDAFEKVDKKSCVLAVPLGSKQGYASADFWSEFENIEEINS